MILRIVCNPNVSMILECVIQTDTLPTPDMSSVHQTTHTMGSSEELPGQLSNFM